MLDEAATQVNLRRAEGSSPEEREMPRPIRIAQHQMDNAIANHRFDQARAHFEEQEKMRQKLREIEVANPPSKILTSCDISEVAAALAGAPLTEVEM